MLSTRSTRFLLGTLAVSALSLLLTGSVVDAMGPDPATACEAAKLKAAGKKAACLATEETKTILGKPSNPAKCEEAFTKAFVKAEAAAAKAGGTCPVTGDVAAIEQRIDATHVGTAQLLAGEGRFHDNGDETVTDANTKLTWEKKDDSNELHDKDNAYDWATGTWIGDVNAEGGTGFVGHNDWRVPTEGELESLVDYSRNFPAIDPVFGPTLASGYWSSTSSAGGPADAWYMNFNHGNVDSAFRSATFFVRAVRGGS